MFCDDMCLNMFCRVSIEFFVWLEVGFCSAHSAMREHQARQRFNGFGVPRWERCLMGSPRQGWRVFAFGHAIVSQMTLRGGGRREKSRSPG